MPIITIKGFEIRRDGSYVERLVNDLKSGVSGIKEMGIAPADVKVLIHTDVVQSETDKMGYVFVDDFYDKDERTPDVCQRVVKTILCVIDINMSRGGIKGAEIGEVIISKVKPENMVYYKDKFHLINK